MSLQYSGGTLINRTFTPTTRAEWVGNVTQALSDAGWATISGTPGSTTAGTDVKMETAAANGGQKIRFRFFDPGSGNCAQVTMKNVSETITSQIVYCLPTAGGGTWRVVANKFTFYAFAIGGANATAVRAVLMGGTLFNFAMSSNDNISFGWFQGSGTTDTDAVGRVTFRKKLRREASSPPSFSGINGSIKIDASTAGAGGMTISVWQGGLQIEDQGFQWEDLSFSIYEPLIAWATGTAVANDSRIKGQLYDALVLNGTWTGETTISFDGHTWLIITDNPTTGLAQTAVLAVAVP